MVTQCGKMMVKGNAEFSKMVKGKNGKLFWEVGHQKLMPLISNPFKDYLYLY